MDNLIFFPKVIHSCLGVKIDQHLHSHSCPDYCNPKFSPTTKKSSTRT